ncbi:MAG: iron ABC transporter permease [Erysipelotrichales bacterium]|nr:iron ABC transporter permease [Erysipelotrichales bacterium]
MNSAKKRFDVWTLISIGIMLMYILFLIYPLFTILKNSFYVSGDSSVTMENYAKFFSNSYYTDSIWNSFKVSFATMILSLVIAIPMAYLFTLYKIRGSRFVQILIVMCMISAPFIGAYSWILLLGRNGVVTQFVKSLTGITLPKIYGFGGILLAMTTRLFPLAFLYIQGGLKNVDNSLLEASANMGCSGVKRFFKVVIPLVMPSILAAALMVFMRAFADFGTPLMIGEGYRTFPVEIYNQFVGETGTNHNFASAIAVIAIVITALIFLIQKIATSKFQFTMNSLHPIEKQKMGPLKSFFVHFFIYGMVIISMLPQIYLAYLSFRNTTPSGQSFTTGYSLDSYIKAYNRVGRSIGNTLKIGIIALIVVVLLAILIAYLVVRRKNTLNNIIDVTSMIPFVIPGSVVGIALVTSFNQKPLVLTATIAIMVIAMTIRRVPSTIRSSIAVLQQIPITIEEAAISLGTSKLKTFFRITVPMIASGIFAGAILSWVSIITELSSSIMLYGSKTITMTVGVYTLVSRGTDGQAAAVATALMVLSGLSLAVFYSFSGDKEISM